MVCMCLFVSALMAEPFDRQSQYLEMQIELDILDDFDGQGHRSSSPGQKTSKTFSDLSEQSLFNRHRHQTLAFGVMS